MSSRMERPHPTSVSIARYGNGMVPVNDLTIKSGKETIRALARLFAALRGSGADGFKVSRGYRCTPLEQREWRLNRFRALAASHSLEKSRRTGLAGDGQARTGRTAAGVYGRDFRPAGRKPPAGGNSPRAAFTAVGLALWLCDRLDFPERSPDPIRGGSPCRRHDLP
ncbi:MAG: hypothetical protein ACLUE8_02685 [Lachnospiraceae bacterium]